jgi:centrosomal protein CEP120
MRKEKYLLVCSFLDGKNFPRRLKTQFIIEAKFDGEQLTTDPVEHSDNLEINQELAWELDKKTLHAHKLQRSVIKCNCYAIGSADSKKEMCGYFVLDVRSAPESIGVS